MIIDAVARPSGEGRKKGRAGLEAGWEEHRGGWRPEAGDAGEEGEEEGGEMYREGWCMGSQEVILEIKVKNRAEVGNGPGSFRAAAAEETNFAGLESWTRSHPECSFHRAKGNGYEPGSEPGFLPVAESETPGLPTSSLLSQGLLCRSLGMLAVGS